MNKSRECNKYLYESTKGAIRCRAVIPSSECDRNDLSRLVRSALFMIFLDTAINRLRFCNKYWYERLGNIERRIRGPWGACYLVHIYCGMNVFGREIR